MDSFKPKDTKSAAYKAEEQNKLKKFAVVVLVLFVVGWLLPAYIPLGDSEDAFRLPTGIPITEDVVFPLFWLPALLFIPYSLLTGFEKLLDIIEAKIKKDK